MKKRAKIKIALLIITIIILSIGIVIYKSLHSSTIIIQIAPTNATILINNKPYRNGIFKTSPKEQAQVSISADGFEPQTINLDIDKHKVTKIFTELIPNDDKWDFYTKEINKDSLFILLSNHGYQPWDVTKITDSFSINHDDSLNNFIKTISIKSITPIEFSICGYPATRTNCDSISINYDYNSECDDTLCLMISGRSTILTNDIIQAIQNKLHGYGYNLNQYPYIYQQNTN